MSDTDLLEKKQESLITLNGHSLTIQQVVKVARQHAQTELDASARDVVKRSAETMRRIAESDVPVYGVNTGYGIFSNKSIGASQAAELSRNLILSHAVGLGPPFLEDIVRAAMLIRANTLAHGHSGVRPEIIETLLGMLNHGVTPRIPSQGSLGSSGDLAPLAHLALVLSSPENATEEPTMCQAWYEGELVSGEAAMAKAGIIRPVLGPKEGLAITNGATFSTALLVLASVEAERLLKTAEVAAAASLEALLGVSDALDPRLHEVRPHPGQVGVARRMRDMIVGSGLIDSHGHVQDAYSLRCAPQIMGPAWDILGFIKVLLAREINAATDNPLLFGEQAISGGNFHGESIGQAADFLKISLHTVGALSERRTFRLTSTHANMGLPSMLISDPEHAGLHSGMMMLQYTAASLSLENQTLAVPDSIHNLPTSGGQEDFNANSTTAGRRLHEILRNLSHILAIELICVAQALDIRKSQYPNVVFGRGTSAVYERIRKDVPQNTKDHLMTGEIQIVEKMIQSGELLRAVEEKLH
jgi:histidine ammonia-lyase